MNRFSAFLASFLAFLNRFGEVVGGFVLGGLYFVLLGPVAVVLRLVIDPLRTRPPRDSAFLRWREENETVASAHRQG